MRHCLASIALIVLLLPNMAWSAKPVTGSSVAIIVDCSLAMERPVAKQPTLSQEEDEEPTSHMDAAQLIVRKMLRELAAAGNHNVGVWLYGHRLAWEADTKQPELLMQDEYLEATVGFPALNGLLPGDDVELAQPLKRFTPQEYESVVARLNVVKPWGEKPLYLAINRALEALADQPASNPRCIIVLTDGGNQQKLARYKPTHRAILDALSHNIVPIHFLHVGEAADASDPVETELRELADQGGGTLVHIRPSDALTVKEVLSSSRKVAALPAVPTVQTGDTGEEVDAKIAAAKAILATPAKPADRTVSGSVVYFGRPVSTATITIEGTNIPQVKTDRQGRFLIRNVPAGRQYKVRVKAVALNTIRDKLTDMDVVADSEEQPFLTIDLK